MNRRKTVLALVALSAAPLPLFAQQANKVWRVGFISGGTRDKSPAIDAFSKGMRDLGYVESKNLIIEWRFVDGKYNRFPSVALELVDLKVDAIVLGTPAAVLAVQSVTKTIPIVMGYSTDPVGNGFVTSLSRPGGNTTGLASSAEDIAPKQLELLRATINNLSRIGFLGNPANPNYSVVLPKLLAAASGGGLTVLPIGARDVEQINAAFATFAKDRIGALAIPSDALYNTHREHIAELALRYRLPTMFSQSEYVEAGGLMAYGEPLSEFFRRAASFVDKIFKGSKPSALPVEQPTKFELVINVKTAKLLGLKVPQSILVRADRIIE